ncbi:MAG: hypothetical protein ACRENE_28070 [Polyangiaceae bacterium]
MRSLPGARPLHLPLALLAPLAALLLVATAMIGTDALGRPLTDEEKKRFGRLLLEADYPGVRLVALRFAYKLTRNRQRAQDLMGRADLRLVRSGWNPAKVDLIRCLCRLVWSEWTHATSETETARKAVEGFCRELEVTEGKPARATALKSSEDRPKGVARDCAVPSHEQELLELEAERQLAANSEAMLAKLRTMLEKAGDEVNLLWLDLQLDAGELLREPAELAALSGRPVEDFYAAAKRRKRAVLRLLASERGVDLVEEESP